ncbi:hypothetical protein IAD21_02955 [Abditibacteriota bacterium]|nr:hypothetical protein IAD21_02955 [Abditibacteriota bacterium]
MKSEKAGISAKFRCRFSFLHVKMPRAMTTLVQRGIASSLLGAIALFLAGCGGGGGGATVPTATPIGTPNGTPTATPIATATPVPGTGGSPVTANQVAFVSNRANPSSSSGDLYKSNLDGSNVVRLTSLNQPLDKPSVSRDGSRLVFQLGESNSLGGTNNIEIGIINANGSGFQKLTDDTTVGGRPDDYNPVFAPNDQYIYWTSTRRAVNENGLTVDGIPHIWRMSGAIGSTGANQEQFVAEASAFPSVDRNGNIAYVALNQTTSPIALRTSANILIKRISDSTPAGQIFDVALSPDGARVAFSAGTTGTSSSVIRAYDVGTTGRVGGTLSAGASNGGSAWRSDSQTLFFDAANGAVNRREVFSSVLPFSTTTQVTQDNTSDNYSPAFLPTS